MDTLRVRVYNVQFGDGILVSVPERGADGTTVTRHLLIDVGNLPSGTGSDDASSGRSSAISSRNLAVSPWTSTS